MKRSYFLTAVLLSSPAFSFAQAIEVTSTGVGIGGVTSPAYSLHSGGDIGVSSDKQFVARYGASETYKATLGWAHLQLGNNGPNWIVAGRDAVGGSLTFVVNNTNNYSYGGFNGTAAMTILYNGNVGIGATSPGQKLEVSGTVRVSGGGIFLDNDQALRAGGGNQALVYRDSANGIYFGSGDANDFLSFSAGGNEKVRITTSGNVGIGTSSPGYKLEVSGSVRATSFISNSTTYADFVFEPEYQLASLSEVESAIKAQRHLPGIPSAMDVKANGIDLAAMQVQLLQKVEELTLYLIANEKEVAAQRQELQRLNAENERLNQKISELSHQ